MSEYAYIDAVIEYESTKKLNTAKEVLTNGRWLNNKDQFIGEDGNTISKKSCVDYHRNQLSLPGDTHRNLGEWVGEILIGATAGFLHLGNYDEFGFSVWNNGRWIEAWTNQEISCYLDDEKEKKIINADEDDYDDFFLFLEERSDVLSKAFENAIACFQSETVALRYMPDKFMAKVIHQEDRWKAI